MKNALRKHIIQQIGPSPKNMDVVLNAFEANRLSRNESILLEGNICRKCFFIVKGCFQIYRTNSNGNRITTGLVFGLDWYTVMDSFKNNTPSKEGIRVIEDSEFLSISKDKFDFLSNSVPQFQLVYRKMLEDSYVESLNRINLLMSLDALEKLKWLETRYPKILSRLTSKDIASFLGISPETLSRVKSKHYKS